MGVFFASQKRVLLLLSTLTFSLIINSSAYGQSLSDSDLVSVGLLAILIILILAAVAIAGNSLVSMAAVRSKSDYKTVPSPANDGDRKSTRLNSSHVAISYAVFCLKKKNKT